MKKSYTGTKSILLGVFLTIFMVSMGKLIAYQIDAKQNQIEMKKLAETMKVDDGDAVNTTSEKPENHSQFKELYARNSDIFGWISIDESNINYPVMYSPKEEEFYLHHNFQKEFEERGLPFLDGKTNIEQSQNFLIYGHNMKDGTAFADLLEYKDERYYKNHPVIHFNTLSETSDYEILAVFYSQIYYTDQKIFRYYNHFNILTKSQYDEYVNHIKSLSIYDTSITPNYGEQLLTLSTCSYHSEYGRFVVVAKRKV